VELILGENKYVGTKQEVSWLHSFEKLEMQQEAVWATTYRLSYGSSILARIQQRRQVVHVQDTLFDVLQKKHDA